jgi:hypothetical protein
MEEKNYEKWAVHLRKKLREPSTSSSRTAHRDRTIGRARPEVHEAVEDNESREERSRNRENAEELEVKNSWSRSTAHRDRSRSRERKKVEEDTCKSDVVEYHSKRGRARSLEDEEQLSASHRDRSRSRERTKFNQTLASTKAGVVELFSKRALARSRLEERGDLPKQEQRSRPVQNEELELEQSSTRSSSSHRERSPSRDQTRNEKTASEDEERYRLPCEQVNDARQGRSSSRERENAERKKKKKERKDKKSERRAAAKDYADGGSSAKKRRRKDERENDRATIELESGPPCDEVLDEFESSAVEHTEGFKSLSPRGIRSEKRAMLNAQDSVPTRKASCTSKMDAGMAIFGEVCESAVRTQERWGNDGFFELEAAKAAAEEQRRLNRIKLKEARYVSHKNSCLWTQQLSAP